MAYQVKSTTKERAKWHPSERAIYNKLHDMQGQIDSILRRVEEHGWDDPDRPNRVTHVIKGVCGNAGDLAMQVEAYEQHRERTAKMKLTIAGRDTDGLPPIDQQEYRVVGISEAGTRAILYEGKVNMHANVEDFRSRESGAWAAVEMEKRLSPNHAWFLLHRKERG